MNGKDDLLPNLWWIILTSSWKFTLCLQETFFQIAQNSKMNWIDYVRSYSYFHIFRIFIPYSLNIFPSSENLLFFQKKFSNNFDRIATIGPIQLPLPSHEIKLSLSATIASSILLHWNFSMKIINKRLVLAFFEKQKWIWQIPVRFSTKLFVFTCHFESLNDSFEFCWFCASVNRTFEKLGQTGRSTIFFFGGF